MNSSDVVSLISEIEAKISFRFTFLRSLMSVWLLCNPYITDPKEVRLVVERHIGINQSVNQFLVDNPDLSDDELASRVKQFSVDVMNRIHSLSDFKSSCRNLGIQGLLIDLIMQYNFCFHSEKTRKSRKLVYQNLLYSFNMIKRGLGRLSHEKVCKSIAETINVLTSEPDPLDPRTVKLIDWSVELINEFYGLNHFKLKNKINNNLNVPFFSSVYETNKKRGGGKRRLYRNQIFSQEDLEDDYIAIFDINYTHNNLCRFAGLVEPNKVRPITIQSETFQQGAIPTKELLLDMWKSTPFGTMYTGWEDSVMDVYRQRDPNISICSVDYNQATNLMKPEATKYVSDSFHRLFEKFWTPEIIVPFENFKRFNDECIGMRTFHIDSAVEICGGQVNNISLSKLSPYLDRQPDGIDAYIYSDTNGNLSEVRGKKKDSKIHLIDQTNGQLMGNPESFVYLCTINLASILGAYISDEDLFWHNNLNDFVNNLTVNEQNKFFKTLNLIRVNGDDGVYPNFLDTMVDNETIFDRQKRISGSFGLEINDLKTWESTSFFSMNSVMFVLDDTGISQGTYLNQSVRGGR